MTASPHLLQGVDPRLPCSPERRCFACLRRVELDQARALLEPWSGWLLVDPAEGRDRYRFPGVEIGAPGAVYRYHGFLEEVIALERETVEAASRLQTKPLNSGLRAWWAWARSRYVYASRAEGVCWLFYYLQRLDALLGESPHPPEWLVKDVSRTVEEVRCFVLAHDLECFTTPLILSNPNRDPSADLSLGRIEAGALRLLLKQPRSLIDRLLRAGAFFYASSTGEELEALACKLEARGGF